MPVCGNETSVCGNRMPVCKNEMPVCGNRMGVGGNEMPVCRNRMTVCRNETYVGRNGMPVGGIATTNRRSQIDYFAWGIASRALRKAAPFATSALAESVLVVLPFASVAESIE